MDFAAVTQMIATIGFPCVICGYMIVKFDKTIDKVSTSIVENTEVIRSLKEMLMKGDKE